MPTYHLDSRPTLTMAPAIRIIAALGEGCFGVVFEAQIDGAEYAIKMVFFHRPLHSIHPLTHVHSVQAQ